MTSTSTSTASPAEPTETWPAYLRAISGDTMQRSIASRVNTDKATVWHWLNGHRIPSAHMAVRCARAYKANPIEALVAAGYLTPAEAKLTDALWADPAAIPTPVLLDEVERRTAGGDAA